MFEFFKKIGLFFVSLYMWTVLFVMAFVILITGLFLLFVSNARVVFRTVRAMLKFMFKIMFVKVEVEHPKDFDFDQSYIIMPNHITFWDIPVICSVLPNYTFGIEAESHFSWPTSPSSGFLSGIRPGCGLMQDIYSESRGADIRGLMPRVRENCL